MWQIRETPANEMGRANGGHPIAWGMRRETADHGLAEIEAIWREVGSRRRDEAARRHDTGTSVVFEIEVDGGVLDIMRVEVENAVRGELGLERQRSHWRRFEVEPDGGVGDHGPGKPRALDLDRIAAHA